MAFKTMKAGLLVLVTVALGACTNIGGSCTSTASATTGVVCMDCGSSVTPTSCETTCGTTGGNYVSTACRADNRTGRCVVAGSTYSFYAPTSVTQAQADCTGMSGTFTAN